MSNAHSAPRRAIVPRLIRVLSIPIIVFWVLVAVGLGLLAPSLDAVADKHSVSLAPQNSPAFHGMMNIGHVFKQFDSDSTAMVVLEGQDKLGDSAHVFYNQIVAKLHADRGHVENIQDFWSDPLTAAGSQSPDGKAAYVQVFLVGAQGTGPSKKSVAAVRNIVASVPSPPGVKAYVAGNTVLNADVSVAGHKSLQLMAVVSIGVILAMLLIVYRSVATAMLSLSIVGIELFAAQGITATAGNLNIIGLTPYAVSMVTMLTIAAGTDYVIFLLGRYQEARSAGQDSEDAFYTAYHGVSHVILGSGLTIAGACMCLTMCTLPYFTSMGLPCAIALLVIVAAALTLAPAILAVGSRFGLLDAKRELATRGWRKVGTAVVRWPVPIIVVTLAIAIIGFVSLLTYVPQYNDEKFTPPDMPANVAMKAAERHFSQARMNPELLMLEADHDLRNPADMLVIDRVAKSVFHLHGIERVQTITRPLGAPIEHSSIPFQIAMQNSGTLQTAKIQNDNTAQMLEQADELSKTVANMEHMYEIMKQLTATTHDIVAQTHDIVDTTNELRDHIADFDDFFRPIRSYFYWDKHCFDIPSCWSLRSIFDTLDGIDELADQLQVMTGSLDHLDQLMPQILATLPPTIASMKTMRDFMVSTHSTMAGIQAHQQELAEGSTLMGNYFDEAKNDDSFYLPPEVFKNPDFERGLKMFVSPDGKAVRLIITHQGDPASVAGIEHVAGIKASRRGRRQGHPAGEREGLTGRYRLALQRHAERCHRRLVDRLHRLHDPDLRDHAVDHPQCGGRPDHRQHGRRLAGHRVWTVRAAVAGHPGTRLAMDRDPAVDRDPARRRFGLQPAGGLAAQGRDPRRTQHRHHPRHGRHRARGHRRRPGVRVHHDVDDRQRPARGRPAGHDHRHRPAGRHAHRAIVHDPLDRRSAGTLVLVAIEHLQDRGERRSRARIRREHRADFKAGDGVNCRSSKLETALASPDRDT